MKSVAVYGMLFVVMLGALLLTPQGTPYEQMVNCTVMVSDGGGHGSGVMVEDGLILTAGHVVDAEPTHVQFNDGRRVEIQSMWRSDDYDVGFVRIDPNDYRTATLSKRPLRVGDTIYHVGTPLDTLLHNSLMKGIISYLGRDYHDWAEGLQGDFWGAPGCSGGPVFDEWGRVIAIVVAGPSRVGACAVVCEPLDHIRAAWQAYEESNTHTETGEVDEPNAVEAYAETVE